MAISFMGSVDDGHIFYATYLESIVQALRGRYVKRGCEVVPTDELKVKVKKGIIMYDWWEYFLSECVVDIPDPLPNRDRADVIVWDYNNDNPQVKVIEGTRWLELDDGSKIPITDRIGDTQIPLAVIIVRSGSSEILSTDIIDVRSSRVLQPKYEKDLWHVGWLYNRYKIVLYSSKDVSDCVVNLTEFYKVSDLYDLEIGDFLIIEVFDSDGKEIPFWLKEKEGFWIRTSLKKGKNVFYIYWGMS